MRAEIVSIGTEILVGSILNSNVRFLSEMLAEQGVDVYRHVTIGDNVARLMEALETALGRADVVICSGGLGPTADDITLEAAARVLDRPRILHKETARRIRERLRRAGLPPSKLSMNQCLLPKDAMVFQNDNGTAPGILCETSRAGERKWILLLPGPPAELEPMFVRQAWPALAARQKRLDSFYVRTVKIAGWTETQVAEKIDSLLNQKPPLTCGIYARAGEVHLKIMAKGKNLNQARRLAAPVEKNLRQIFGRRIFGFDADTPESVAVSLLQKNRATLGIAESCTGGLASHLVTEVAGSSSVYRGSIVAYKNTVKQALLSVSHETLARYGAVSQQTSVEMARGIRKTLGTSVGLAITGIAGPSGGTVKKPVGLVYIALCDNRGTLSRRYLFVGQRSLIKLKSAKSALDLLRLRLS